VPDAGRRPRQWVLAESLVEVGELARPLGGVQLTDDTSATPAES
jgi:hypothetical protein